MEWGYPPLFASMTPNFASQRGVFLAGKTALIIAMKPLHLVQGLHAFYRSRISATACLRHCRFSRFRA